MGLPVTASGGCSPTISIQQRQPPGVDTVIPTYTVSRLSQTSRARAQLDRGANGCVFTDAARMKGEHPGTANVTAFNNHTIRNCQLVHGGAYATSDQGPCIIEINQSPYCPEGDFILSCIQLEQDGCIVHDKSAQASGISPHIEKDGHRFPLYIENGLVYLPMRPCTDGEWETLPHIRFTSPSSWDPRCMDTRISSVHTSNSSPHEGSPVSVSRADVRSFGTHSIAGELRAAAAVHRMHRSANAPPLRRSPRAHNPPALPSSPSVEGEVLDPTLSKKKRKDAGETETDTPDDAEISAVLATN